MTHFAQRSILLGIFVLLVVLVACRGERQAGTLTFERYIFESADGQKIDAELGRLEVPENRKIPNGKTIQIVFVRLKSTAKIPGSPMVFLAGGPGQAGIAQAQGPRSQVILALREFGDVIAVDQRGTGLSRPALDCDLRLNYPLAQPATQEGILLGFEQRARVCADGWKRKGVDLTAYNTYESADDIAALRQALGTEKISLLATSYGTTLALTVIKRYQQVVDRAIMIGVESPAQTLKLPSDGERQLGEISRLCRADPKISLLIPDLTSLMVAVSERLKGQPVTVEIDDPDTRRQVTVTVGDFDLRLMIAQSIGYHRTIQKLPATLYQISRGDFSPLARWALNYRRQSVSALPAAMDCSSGVSPERWNRIRDEESKSTFGRELDFPFPDVCQAWGVPQLEESFRAPIISDVPTLFISGTLDGRTPVRNAEEVRQGFSNSSLLILENVGHSDALLLSSPRIKEVMLEFVRGLQGSSERIVVPFDFEPIASPGPQVLE